MFIDVVYTWAAQRPLPGVGGWEMSRRVLGAAGPRLYHLSTLPLDLKSRILEYCLVVIGNGLDESRGHGAGKGSSNEEMSN